MHDTLILNTDGQPLSLLPISAKSWQRAIHELCNNHVQVLHTYDDWVVRSPSTEFHVPSVVILNRYKRSKTTVRFSPRMIKLRDNYTCQYCGERFAETLLTMDHVLPHSHGGTKSWENIVTACQPCNGKRGNNTRIKPNVPGYKPSYWELVAKRKMQPIHIPHEAWLPYLDWQEDLVHVISRK